MTLLRVFSPPLAAIPSSSKAIQGAEQVFGLSTWDVVEYGIYLERWHAVQCQRLHLTLHHKKRRTITLKQDLILSPKILRPLYAEFLRHRNSILRQIRLN